jgi:dienelactone hydrolase
MSNGTRFLVAAALLGSALPAGSQDATVPWAEMEKHFAPPEEYRGKFGEYRSVLTFDDGSAVKSKEDWPRRREEIRRYWHGVLGAWPPLVEKPRMPRGASERVENFTRHAVEVEIAPGKLAGTQHLLVPDGPGPFPAVLVTWYGSADSAGLTKKQHGVVDFGAQLARRGFVALCVGGFAAEKGVQPLSSLAYAAANCRTALAQIPEVDPARIGIVGHSFGGKWAMFASCLDDGFACAVWIDPGIVWNEKDPNANYWEKWYLGWQFDHPVDQQRQEGTVRAERPRTGAYRILVAEGRDLHELHALMAPRPFLVSGGAQDRPVHWTALNHSIRLNELLGHSNRVAMTMRNGHTPTAESNAQVLAFFEHFLREKTK